MFLRGIAPGSAVPWAGAAGRRASSGRRDAKDTADLRGEGAAEVKARHGAALPPWNDA